MLQNCQSADGTMCYILPNLEVLRQPKTIRAGLYRTFLPSLGIVGGLLYHHSRAR